MCSSLAVMCGSGFALQRHHGDERRRVLVASDLRSLLDDRGRAIMSRCLERHQIARCRAVEHAAVRIEPRTVTWAVPRLLRAVPANDAAKVRTRRGSQVALTARVLVCGDQM